MTMTEQRCPPKMMNRATKAGLERLEKCSLEVQAIRSLSPGVTNCFPCVWEVCASRQKRGLIPWCTVQASAPNVNPFSTSATIPYYYIPMTFANLMSAALTTSLEQALLDAVLASVPSTSNVWSYLSFTSNADLPSAALEIDVFVFFSDGDMPTAFQFSRNVPYLVCHLSSLQITTNLAGPHDKQIVKGGDD